ncbi:tRNA pseudouridine38-40 synthase [Stackebrandtia endophytica]|uniref:tRNA pseudouridine synthase A n=1 Tax=Stackebrandtia endophytica TaxID=1496996 RepID=A0A543AZY6_9ACTN|nr:tRNA pseudouridine(38-40) synthase TruA [Stackebrandtia endophytica]TQL78116.1 tRNA pseudouridine38-40 synthase [Stackebrandtia endophytica]
MADESGGATVDAVRLRLDIGYDGTDFAGWARQPGQRTVAGEIATALGHLFPGFGGLTVAGRTDAGVHATGQVAHVDVPAETWRARSQDVLWRLRGILPPDVRVKSVVVVDASFNARFAALSRRYVYRVSDTVWGVEPVRRSDTLAWPRPLDLGAMRSAATVLLGQHDFAAFCKRREGATTIRALQRLDWQRETDGVLAVTVVADAFCHSMVRSLVGAMLAVGDGRRDADWLAGLLTLGHRSGEVVVAPAHGLTLAEVEYPAASEWDARATQTRRMRTLDA